MIYYKDLDPSYKVIDIRDNYSYNNGHYKNAINIPMNSLLNDPGKYLNINDTYYIYCNRGINSKRTCELLRLLNYNVINVIDGYQNK